MIFMTIQLRDLFFLICILTSFTLGAQSPIIKCGTDERMEIQFKENPELQKNHENTLLNANAGSRSSVVQTIPVHVIIVHPVGQAVGTGDNLSVDHIMSQIDVLNEDFRRTNSDAGNTPAEFAAGDTEIEFCMATTDPNGQPTDGITRYATNNNDMAIDAIELSIKAATSWDHTSYMNIWVSNLSGGLLGYAYFPGTGPDRDGVVVVTGAFGGPGYATLNPYNLGRTATHEVGHYLGLYHVWRNSGCGLDDGIADTPIQDDEYFGCPSHPQASCGNNDMFMNYMDYVNDACMNAFSIGQGNAMQAVLNTTRSGLVASAATNCGSSVAPLSAQVLSQTPASCFNSADGTVIIDAIGGTTPYTYSLNNGPFQTSNTFFDLPPGPHVVTVQDNGGQSVNVNFLITSPPELFLFADAQMDVLCNGDANGFVSLFGTGGTQTGFQFAQDGGPFTPNPVFNNLEGGTYVFTVLDLNDCTSTLAVTIQEPDPIAPDVADIMDPNCNGDGSGEVTIEATGGTPDYIYELNGQMNNTGNFTNLSGGSYTVVVSDLNNCTNSASFEIEEPDPLILSLLEIDSIDCNGETAVVTLEATGGEGDLFYYYDPMNAQDSPVFSDLMPGNYDFIVKDDGTECFDTVFMVNIPEADAIEIIVDEIVNVECFGDESGSVQLSGNGGEGTLNFMLGEDENTTGLFTGLTSGLYPVVVTDENDCSEASSVEVLAESTLEINVDNQDEVSCFEGNNGAITVSGTGGAGNYTYSFEGGAFDNNNTFTNLEAGMYEIVIQDDVGCLSPIMVEITEPEVLSATIMGMSDVSCFDGQDGSVSFEAAGGNSDYTFELNGVENTTGVFNNLEMGDYTVVVTDINNCSTTASVSINQPTIIEITFTNIVQSNCDGDPVGAFVVSAEGGSGNFTYTANGVTNTIGIFEDLASGSYTVQVTDGSNCMNQDDVVVPSASSISAEATMVTNIQCNGEQNGSVVVSGQGGTGQLTYELNGVENSTGIFNDLAADDYVVNVIDEENCITVVSFMITEPDVASSQITMTNPTSCFNTNDGSTQVSSTGGSGSYVYDLNGAQNTTGVFNNLPQGPFSIVITDSNGCPAGSVNGVVTSPDAIDLDNTTSTTATSCFNTSDGSMSLSANGGVGNFSYSFNGEVNQTGLFNNVPGGTQSVIVEDGNGCSESFSLTIQQPAEINFQVISTEDNPCFGDALGSVELSATGGVGNFNYALENNTNTTGIFEGLQQGNYTALVTDGNNCETTVDFGIEEATLLSGGAENFLEDTGMSDGAVSVAGSGGTSPYSYSIDGGTSFQNENIFDNLESGTYTVIIRDAEGCQFETEVVVELRTVRDNFDIFNVGIIPNPNNGQFVVNYESNGPQELTFRTYDAIGQFVGQVEVQAERGMNSFNMNLLNYSDGVYVLEIQGIRDAAYERFVVNNN